MIEGLKGRLVHLAAHGQTITYGDLARELTLPSPTIATLSAMLETLMHEDAAASRPFLAAVCVGRLGDGMPAMGFFEKAAELDSAPTSDPTAFVASQRAALSALYGPPPQ